jgi:hypothetical protein
MDWSKQQDVGDLDAKKNTDEFHPFLGSGE